MKAGVHNILGPASKSLKAQLRQAGSMGVPHVAIIGEREAESGTVTLRNMTDRTQEEVGMGEVAKRLSSKHGTT